MDYAVIIIVIIMHYHPAAAFSSVQFSSVIFRVAYITTTSSGSPFQIRGPETLKVRLQTVDSRNIGTTRRLELAERSARRPCRSATRLSVPRYRGAVSSRTLYMYVSTANLYGCADNMNRKPITGYLSRVTAAFLLIWMANKPPLSVSC